MRVCGICRLPSAAFLCGDPACREVHNKRAREYQQKKRAEAAAQGESYGSQWRERKSNSVCVVCGVPVGHGRSVNTKCRKCHHPRAPRIERARRRADRAAAGTAGVSVWVAGRCWRCGDSFVGHRGRHCSVRCRRRDRAAERRALERGCKVTPGRRYAVHERDNWVCQICGDPTDRAAHWTDLAAPTIDHRIPLNAGGAHAPENWQTAHSYCNSWKRDLVGVEFAEVAA